MLAGCVVLLAIGPLASAQAAGTASITGTVTSTKTPSEKLPGIQVSAQSNEGTGESGFATTNGAGEYEIKNLAKGSYTVTFTSPSRAFVTREETVTLVEATAKTLNASLKTSASISGTVTNAATSGGLKGVSVFVSQAGGFNEGSATTESNGHYSIAGLAPGTYTVAFSPPFGFVSQSTSTSLVEGQAREVNAALHEGGKISGRVTDAYTHADLAKIGVSASGSSGSGETAVTNTNGEYTITGLATGSYKLTFSWEFSEAEVKAFEKAPRFIPKYITQYFNGQPSEATANTVAATEGAVTSGINVAMVPSAPVNAALPAVSGTPTVGSQLSCSNGSWTGESLQLPVGWPLTNPFSYQWQRGGVAIAGATTNSYLVQAADLGHGLTCEVTASTEAGRASARSISFAVVSPIPVVSTSASKLAVVRNATKVSIVCANATCAGSVEVVERTVVKRRKGHKRITKKVTTVLAKGSYSLAAGKTGAIMLRLTAAGKKKLAHARHHRASAKLVISVKGGKQFEKTVLLAAKK